MKAMQLAKLLLITAAALLLGAAKMPEFSHVGVGDKAPAFKVTTVAGDTIDTEQMAGKVVLVNFFATWCGPCKRKMPHLDKELYQGIKHDDFVMVSIGREHSTEEVAEFKKSHGYAMPFAADPARAVYSQYAEKMIPRTVVIGRDGMIKWHASGSSQKDLMKMKALIQQELESS